MLKQTQIVQNELDLDGILQNEQTQIVQNELDLDGIVQNQLDSHEKCRKC